MWHLRYFLSWKPDSSTSDTASGSKEKAKIALPSASMLCTGREYVCTAVERWLHQPQPPARKLNARVTENVLASYRTSTFYSRKDMWHHAHSPRLESSLSTTLLLELLSARRSASSCQIHHMRAKASAETVLFGVVCTTTTERGMASEDPKQEEHRCVRPHFERQRMLRKKSSFPSTVGGSFGREAESCRQLGGGAAVARHEALTWSTTFEDHEGRVGQLTPATAIHLFHAWYIPQYRKT